MHTSDGSCPSAFIIETAKIRRSVGHEYINGVKSSRTKTGKQMSEQWN